MNISANRIRGRLAALGTAGALCAATLAGATVVLGASEAHAAGSFVAMDYAALVDRHGPAVVHVSVREKLAKTDDKATSSAKPDVVPSNSFGSGFIVSPDGYILTNAHVVSQATQLRVTLKDKRELPARIVGEDATTDVAVLKVDAHDLPTVTIGDPAAVRVGEPVAAIGSPFGFEHSVTAGIVSAKSRNVDDLLVPFIQTDAAVNPGNSGGPLFDAEGKVIGINSRIWTRSGGFQGLSFAIPIDLAMRIADDLKTGRPIVRGRIGVNTQAVTSELARAFGLDRPRGALVTSVDAGGPANAGGVQTGDIVVRAAGRDIETTLDLQRIVGSQPLGAIIGVDILREGLAVPLRVAVAQVEKSRAAVETVSVSVHEKLMPLGLELRAMSSQEQQRLGVSDGLFVEAVVPRSPAVRAELKAGDLILQVRGRPIRQVADFRDGVESAAAEGAPVAVLTMRGDEKRFVALELDR